MWEIAAVLVYDISDAETFEKVYKWVVELKSFNSSEIEIAIVGNKCDLENIRQVKNKAVEDYARKIGALHFLASAKSGKGVSEIFTTIAKSKPITKK